MAEKYQAIQQKVEKIEKIDKVDPSTANLGVSETEEVSAPQKAKFEEAQIRAETKWDQAYPKTILVAAQEPVQKLSPIAQMSSSENKIERLRPVTVDQVVEQANDIRGQLQTPINKIAEAQNAQPDLRISPAHDAILSDKLIHVESTLKTALNKVGVEVTAQDIEQKVGQKPLVKFLNMLTNSDRQINTMVAQINALQNSKTPLTPEKLLAVQIKLSFVTQQIEFFTNVLNKALEGTKTIMNVQV